MLTGTVSVPAGRTLPEMVVYLERPAGEEPVKPGANQSAASAGDSPCRATISQKDGKFVPSFLVVPVGAVVEFRNDEPTDLEHNVFSRSAPKPFDLGLSGPKDKPHTITFDKPGEVALYCSVHRYMDATVYVTPTAYAAQPGKDGTFEIKDIPPGNWVLRTWQRRKRFGDAEIPVTIAAGQNPNITVEMKR